MVVDTKGLTSQLVSRLQLAPSYWTYHPAHCSDRLWGVCKWWWWWVGSAGWRLQPQKLAKYPADVTYCLVEHLQVLYGFER